MSGIRFSLWQCHVHQQLSLQPLSLLLLPRMISWSLVEHQENLAAVKFTQLQVSVFCFALKFLSCFSHQSKTSKWLLTTSQGWNINISSLPEGVRDGCALTLDETSVMLIGGITESENYTSTTTIFNSVTGLWSPAIDLHLPRVYCSCGVIRWTNALQIELNSK